MEIYVIRGQSGGKDLYRLIMQLGHTYEEAIELVSEMRAIVGNYETPDQVGAGLHELEIFLKEHSSQQEQKSLSLDDTDPPNNLLHLDPPKQKKYRSSIPDKRAINRRNRKRK